MRKFDYGNEGANQIPFQQLLIAIKSLTASQKARLKKELADEEIKHNDKDAYIEMLLNGPVFTEKDVNIIEENRKSIAKWRMKKLTLS